MFVISLTVVVSGPLEHDRRSGEDSGSADHGVVSFNIVDDNTGGDNEDHSGRRGFGYGSSFSGHGAGGFRFPSYKETADAGQFPDDWKSWYETLKNMQKELMDSASGWHGHGSFGGGGSSTSVSSSTTSDGVTVQCTSTNGEPEKCTTMTTTTGSDKPVVVSYQSPDGSSSGYASSWSSGGDGIASAGDYYSSDGY